MADTNSYLTISMITRESARVLVNNLVFGQQINREYSKQFAKTGAKIGNVINIRKPPRLLGRSGMALAVEAAVETSVPLTLNQLDGCDLEFGDDALVLSIDDFKKRFIRPMMASVSNKIDFKGLSLYKKVFNVTGTPGSTPTSLRDAYMLAGTYMDNQAAPQDGQRAVVITSLMQTYIVDALKGLFQATQQIAKQYRTGRMGEAVNFDWYFDQNVNTHTIGVYGGTPLVNGANQTGATISLKGFTAGSILNEGDAFTMAGCNSTNPQNRQSNGQLMWFVVGAGGAVANGAGIMSVPVYPALTPGQLQQGTVDASPANSAAVTIFGASGTQTPQGLAFHPDAFVLGSADFEVPNGVDMAERVASDKLGLSIRFVRQFDIRSNTRPCRSDVLYDYAAVYPELACRIAA